MRVAIQESDLAVYPTPPAGPVGEGNGMFDGTAGGYATEQRLTAGVGRAQRTVPSSNVVRIAGQRNGDAANPPALSAMAAPGSGDATAGVQPTQPADAGAAATDVHFFVIDDGNDPPFRIPIPPWIFEEWKRWYEECQGLDLSDIKQQPLPPLPLIRYDYKARIGDFEPLDFRESTQVYPPPIQPAPPPTQPVVASPQPPDFAPEALFVPGTQLAQEGRIDLDRQRQKALGYRFSHGRHTLELFPPSLTRGTREEFIDQMVDSFKMHKCALEAASRDARRGNASNSQLVLLLAAAEMMNYLHMTKAGKTRTFWTELSSGQGSKDPEFWKLRRALDRAALE